MGLKCDKYELFQGSKKLIQIQISKETINIYFLPESRFLKARTFVDLLIFR